ncbi:hypothetical protein GYN24_10235, partial [Lactococcus piscium]|uniref:hypothetical protein n=1 Tax=Pseudolactococcus paracarnosus TaxID=2749962 RepID=UPI001FBB68AF
KLGKLQSNTKNGIITELLKKYESAEYVKGSRSHKAYFEIGIKREQELSNADMIEKGYYKANANNIKTHNIIALKMFKSYIAELDDDVTYKSMTRLNWLKAAGITSSIQNLNEIDEMKHIDVAFRSYYKDDVASSLKNVLSFCLKQLKVKEAYATLYWCDASFDSEEDEDENGNKKRLLDDIEVKKMKIFVDALKVKHNVTKFMLATNEFKNELRDYYRDNLKSESIWIEIELDIVQLKNDIDNAELSTYELDELRSQFMSEFQKYRNSTYVRREFKRKIKGKKGMFWRYEASLQEQPSNFSPYKEMENRSYFKFMTDLDLRIGFTKADTVEYDKMDKEYKATVEDNDVIKLVDDCKQNNIIYLQTHMKTNNELDELFK